MLCSGKVLGAMWPAGQSGHVPVLAKLRMAQTFIRLTAEITTKQTGMNNRQYGLHWFSEYHCFSFFVILILQSSKIKSV